MKSPVYPRVRTSGVTTRPRWLSPASRVKASRSAFLVFSAVFSAVLTLTACNAESRASHNAAPAAAGPHVHAPAAAATEQAAARAAVTLVERDKVCMVNDQHFGTPQIPVEVEGKTYYGCCEGCKATLAEDATARMAVDPVSRKPVDKALAFIGAFPNGQVLYFESAENLAAWNERR